MAIMQPTAHLKQPVLEPVGKQVTRFRMHQTAIYNNLFSPQLQTTTLGIPSNRPGTQSTGTHRQEDHAVDITGEHFVQSRHANPHTPATNVTKVILGVNVTISLTLPSFLHHSNPLPTQVQITINIDIQTKLVRYVVHGLYNRFDIGFNGTTHTTKPKKIEVSWV